MTSVIATQVAFEYNSKTAVFDGHSLTLQSTSSNSNTLYGIIGSSGVGKTTLLSILGGQLKPTSGTVEINGTNIYAVDDTVRRSLIALHIQAATSMRGTLKYNLLFGLPYSSLEDELPGMGLFSDSQLIDVLSQVGLWSLFEGKEGLETLIGESGLNLSGGQRQRLNFANVYLRAQHFSPSLILIDEPTSSLDEVSEQAVTEMITTLAQNAIVLVIAHRLKTLDAAAGLLDLSLLKDSNQLTFYSHAQLKKVSKYYRDLLSGKVRLDS